MARAIVIVLDSVGVGGAPDAAVYGDEGADTVGHIAEWCHSKGRPLRLPSLTSLGLGFACKLATGRVPPGLDIDAHPIAIHGTAIERSAGKDTITGHWEIAGVPLSQPWGYFLALRRSFPEEFIAELCRRCGLPGVLGDCHASGTAIIAELGEEHLRSGKPICYTSADSVFQIAAHEQHFGLDRLYAVCRVAQELLRPLSISRVIARPFMGETSIEFRRTRNRRDFADPSPSPTVLDIAAANGREVVSVGKTADIFAHSGTGKVVKGDSNDRHVDQLIELLPSVREGGLVFVNLVDFDTEYGHRRDVAGYARALESFDRRLPLVMSTLERDDLLIVTADHGCDPTWKGSDHTREQVPVLAYGPRFAARCLGRLDSFANIGASVSAHLSLPRPGAGAPFL